MSKNALIIVDVQNDFVEGGSLAVEGGRDLGARIARWLNDGAFDAYDYIVTTQDAHIDPGSHFSDKPDFINSWPIHCVAGTEGAEIIAELAPTLEGRVDIAVKKGQWKAAYSGFEGTAVPASPKTDALPAEGGLASALRALGVEQIDIVGIAADYCVGETALDGAREGFRTRYLRNLTVGISKDGVRRYERELLPAAQVEITGA